MISPGNKDSLTVTINIFTTEAQLCRSTGTILLTETIATTGDIADCIDQFFSSRNIAYIAQSTIDCVTTLGLALASAGNINDHDHQKLANCGTISFPKNTPHLPSLHLTLGHSLSTGMLPTIRIRIGGRCRNQNHQSQTAVNSREYPITGVVYCAYP